ncbi:MAG: stage II sporulation protein R [Oscillospiraceae bacterium]|jgi:stage II sporulation protein R|nr:stage II sporulation protein R [Oscillospiraceae bacterium]
MKFNTVEKSAIFSFVFLFLLSFTGFAGKCKSINEKIFRFHILANSDEQRDQALKIKVRDRVLVDFGEEICECKNKEDAREKTKKLLNKIEDSANDEVKKQGYNYKVTASTENTYFDTRVYDQVSLPAGNYEALKILIGKGEGKNWWCVMFPNMCLPAAQSKHNNERSQKIDDVLSKSETEIVKNKSKYEIRFKMFEIYQALKRNF